MRNENSGTIPFSPQFRYSHCSNYCNKFFETWGRNAEAAMEEKSYKNTRAGSHSVREGSCTSTFITFFLHCSHCVSPIVSKTYCNNLNNEKVEGLYCKRPIQCLASSAILTPHPSPPGECVTPAFGAGGGHTRWVERGGVGSIVRKVRDTALYSIYLSTL